MIGDSVALAAYHVLPASWERPLIEQVLIGKIYTKSESYTATRLAIPLAAL